MKKVIITILSIVMIILVGVLSRYFILGGAKVVILKTDKLSWAIQSSLTQGPNNTYVPILNRDYKVSDTKFFDSNTWIVVSLVPINNFSDSAKVVFKAQNDNYQRILGPGNSFIGADLNNLPSDVAEYISR